MYFYLSKTLGAFAVPSYFFLLIIVSGWALSWRSRFSRLGRRLTIAGVSMLALGALTPIGTALLVPLENRFPEWNENRGPPSGIVVLGGVVNTYISHWRNEISLDASANRLVAAVELYRRYPELRIVFSGGNSNLVFRGAAEANFAVPLLVGLGVARDHIAVDAAARNTFENAISARRVADPKPGERWLLVTSASHMPRAVGLFRAAGFPVEAYPVDFKTGGWRDLKALPSLSLHGLAQVDLAAHEWEGLVVDRITGRTNTLFPGPSDSAAGG